MTSATQARVAFLILSDDPARALPGLVMATRMKANRNADVRVLFFGPGVRLAASGAVDRELEGLRDAGIAPKACVTNVEQYGLTKEIGSRPVDLLAAGAEVEQYALGGYTVLSF
jgi:hypothetical protein